MKKIALAALIAAASVTSAFAGEVYVAGSIGQSSFDINKGRIDGLLTSAGAAAVSSSLNKTDTAYKIQVGYQFNQNFAVEGGYIDLGKAKYSASFTGGGANADAKASGLNIAALGILPINQSFAVFGKLGLINAKVESTVSATGPGGSASASVSSTDWRPNYGIGVNYNVSKQFSIRAEYEQFSKLGNASRTGEADVNLLSVGVAYKF